MWLGSQLTSVPSSYLHWVNVWLRVACNLLGDKFTLHTQHWCIRACSMTEINHDHQFMVCIE